MTEGHFGSAAVGIIGSAGGIAALIELLRLLSADFPFPILLSHHTDIVAQHLAPRGPSILPEVFALRGQLSVKWAEDGEKPQRALSMLPGRTRSRHRGGRLYDFAASAVCPERPALICC